MPEIIECEGEVKTFKKNGTDEEIFNLSLKGKTDAGNKFYNNFLSCTEIEYEALKQAIKIFENNRISKKMAKLVEEERKNGNRKGNGKQEKLAF